MTQEDMQHSKKKSGSDKAKEKQERMAAKLRENLRRRKEQSRERRDTGGSGA